MANPIKSLNTPKTKTLVGEPAASKEKVNDSAASKGDHEVRRRAILLAVKIVFIAVFCYIVFFVIFGLTRMGDYSMYPSIKDGDLMIYYRLENNFNNGDVVAVDLNGKEEIMRIIASPGQTVNINKDGGLTVDGQPSTHEAFYETYLAESFTFSYPYLVSQDCYFMLNDYRSNTNDSRIHGEICKPKIKGRIISKIQVRDL